MLLKGNVFMFGDNINTDQIIPARYCNTINLSELAEHCMEDADSSFISRIDPGDIIAAGENFGCGSSREVAPLTIKAAGISCVIAKSFARIFYRNAINIGLHVIECVQFIQEVKNNDLIEIEPDKCTIYNISQEKVYEFNQYNRFILKIVKSGGLLKYIKLKNLP